MKIASHSFIDPYRAVFGALVLALAGCAASDSDRTATDKTAGPDTSQSTGTASSPDRAPSQPAGQGANQPTSPGKDPATGKTTGETVGKTNGQAGAPTSKPAATSPATPQQARSFAQDFACSSPLCAHMELFEVGAHGPVEVAVDDLHRDGKPGTRIGSHTFASVEAFASCLRNTSASATSHGLPEHFGACDAPASLAEALLGTRAGPVPAEYSCQGDCCTAVSGEPSSADLGSLRVAEVCLRPSGKGARKVVLHRPQTGRFAERAAITRKLAIDFGTGDGAALRSHFAGKSRLSIEMNLSSDHDDSRNRTIKRNFASARAFVDCLRVPDEGSDKTIGKCRASKEWAAPLRDQRHAFTEVRECTPQCCELGHTNDRHHTLFLTHVCFNPHGSRSAITGLKLSSSD